ncbi:hypothetical protein ACHWQZ_G012094 [Mnemiopsis leidyi]
MWWSIKITLLIAPVLGDLFEDEEILLQKKWDSGSDSDSDHHWPDPWSPSSDSEWEMPTFQPITFPPIPWDSSSSSESESDDESNDDTNDGSDESDFDEFEVCELPKIENGYLMDTNRPIKEGESRRIRCNAGYCLSDSRDHYKLAPLTNFTCTRKMAQEDVYCGLPVCVEDICKGGEAMCKDGQGLCSESKVTIVKEFLKIGHSSINMSWRSKFEQQAEGYLNAEVSSSLSLESGAKRLLKFSDPALCNRHLANGYFNRHGSYLEAYYRGGEVGCAVSPDYRNIIACVVKNM